MNQAWPYPGLKPGLSLWAATAGPPPRRPPLDGDGEADLVVIGGGYTGLSCALHAAETGADVVVLEAESVGYGASGRNGGQVNPGLRVAPDALARRFGEAEGRALADFAEGAPDFLADLVARHRLDCGFERNGMVKLAHSPAALRGLRRAGERLARSGVAAELLDRDGVDQRVGTARYPGGLFDPRGGAVHPLKLCRELARIAVQHGARIHERSQAVAVHLGGRGWTVRTARGALQARSVLIATNGYSGDLVPGLSRTLLPVNSFQIATAPLSHDLRARILPGRVTAHDTRRLVLYFRSDLDGRVVIGGRASFSTDRADQRAKDFVFLRPILAGIFPDLADSPIEHAWTGLVAITRDFLPHRHAPAPGLHAMLGYNGRGVALAVRSGAMMADLILRGDAPAVPLSPIAPIPLHRWRAPALNLLMRWNRALDAVGR